MEPLPKVLFLNHSVRDGGPGKSLFYILKYLDREKLSPYVMMPKDDVFSEKLKSEGIYENIIIDKRFPENLKRPRLSADTDNQAKNGGGGILPGLMKFISVVLNLLDLVSLVITSPYFIKKNGINVIYCNGTQAKIAGALMGLVSWCPVIWHVRNIQQTRVLGSIIYTLARLTQVKRIICVSGAAANQFPYAKDKLRVIYNGIDEEEYDPSNTVGDLRRDYGIPARTIVVGSTGRIVPRKGYPLFIEAAHNVLKRTANKKKDIKFVIVGDTPYFFQADHLAYIKDLVREYELEDYFIFTGYRADVRASLKDFDIFVIPSNYPDPFPRSVIEAMSFALPVIGFRVGGIVESVEDGVTGILNEPGDAEGMGEAILKLASDKKLIKKMGKAGRERVKTKFSARRITEEIQRNILEVLGSIK